MVTIGITGHRILTDLGRLHAGLGEVVRHLDQSFAGDWTVVSALAEGADRLVARRLLDHPGSRLVAVLPLPRDDYECDFEAQASRAEFRELFARAHEIVEIPPQPDRDRAYEAAGLAVLDRCDVLIAVWDGKGAQGRGGTGGIVAQARGRGIPLAWIHAGNRMPSTLLPTSLGDEQGEVTLERFR